MAPAILCWPRAGILGIQHMWQTTTTCDWLTPICAATDCPHAPRASCLTTLRSLARSLACLLAAKKVILLGNSGVGKSNLIARFHNNDFCEDFESTVGVEFVTKRITVDGVPVKLQVNEMIACLTIMCTCTYTRLPVLFHPSVPCCPRCSPAFGCAFMPCLSCSGL